MAILSSPGCKEVAAVLQRRITITDSKGYLTEFCKLIENCKVSSSKSSLVRIPPSCSTYNENESNNNSGPDVIRTRNLLTVVVVIHSQLMILRKHWICN
jgi:hypothetical protein